MQIKKIIKNKRNIKYIVILISLLGIWVMMTLLYIAIFDQSALILSRNHGVENFLEIKRSRLLNGEKISGEFTALENNLGIVSLRFEKLPRIPYDQEDTLVFRIKEKNAEDWHYEKKYRSGLTFDVPFYPFGFPRIPNSKDKAYYFELESLNGNSKNGVILSSRSPFLVSKYQESKERIFNSPVELLEFVYKKFVNSFRTIDIAYSSLIFLLPFIFYVSWIGFSRTVFDKQISRIKLHKSSKKIFGLKYSDIFNSTKILISHWMMIVFIAVLLIDIVFLQVLNDMLFICVPFIWLMLCFIYGKNNTISFVVAISFLLISPIALFFGDIGAAERAAVWSFIFCVTAVIQNLIELNNKKESSKI